MNWPRPIKRWLRTREFRLFRWGIPALLAGATWLAFGIWLAFWNPYQLKSHYAETAGQALAVKDFETIRVASQRLLGLGIEPQRKYLFNVALSLAGLQREKEAASLLATIAPVEKPGYLPA
ncbi:MAG: hypothetical protein MUF81_18435, partial [Verrucomicrobia bacterium]|nr:hypothetical protein [Verrucomicrobiota bacterium]